MLSCRDGARTGGRLYRQLLDSKWASELLSGIENRPGAADRQDSAPCAVYAEEAADDAMEFSTLATREGNQSMSSTSRSLQVLRIVHATAACYLVTTCRQNLAQLLGFHADPAS